MNQDVLLTDLVAIRIDTPDLNNVCHRMFKDGYRNPIITTKIGETVWKQPMIVWKKNKSENENDTTVEVQKRMLKTSMKNVIRSVKANQTPCELFIDLSPSAIDYLYNHTRYITFQFHNKQEQREISGRFQIENNVNNTVILKVDESSVQKGEKESASYIESFGTFHTHPYDAYKKYKVCIAWPSADDYISFMYMYGLCCSGFHIVATLEGIYLISLQKYIPPGKIMNQFEKYKEKVEYHHGVDYPETSEKCDIKTRQIDHEKIKNYVKRINQKGMFNLVFTTWEDCKHSIRLRYAPVEGNCIVSTGQGQLFNK